MGRNKVDVGIKWQIIGMYKTGKPSREIGRQLGVSKTCVNQTVAKFLATGSVIDLPRVGRPRVTTPREDRTLAIIAKKNRTASIPTIQRQYLDRTGLAISRMTCSRRLRSQGLYSHVALKKPFLTDISRRNRRIWCSQKKNWGMERWNKVLFSDEARFQLFPNQRIRVRRTSTEKFLPECLSPTVQGGGGSVMIWGCFSGIGTGILRFTDGTMNSAEYISTMKDNMLPSAKKLHNNYFVYQQDNAPCHKSRATMKWFEDNEVPLLTWPSRSPDLNPIENLWRYMGMKLRPCKPKNRNELREALSTIWNDITVEQCQKLVNSMPKRVRLCHRAGGGPIDY